jgi:hypothetical protein
MLTLSDGYGGRPFNRDRLTRERRDGGVEGRDERLDEDGSTGIVEMQIRH